MMGISLVNETFSPVERRAFVSAVPPSLCRYSSGCSIFSVISLDGSCAEDHMCTARECNGLRDATNLFPISNLVIVIDNATTIGCLAHRRPCLLPLASVPSSSDHYDFNHEVRAFFGGHLNRLVLDRPMCTLTGRDLDPNTCETKP